LQQVWFYRLPSDKDSEEIAVWNAATFMFANAFASQKCRMDTFSQ